MSRNWTEDQKKAIEARGGGILISAAAGSGKTAVLVERVIRLLSDEEHPCDADKLLIVTFTRAAAAEMRERIGAALSRGICEHPENRVLRRQKLLLDNAKICTIDSFCSALVRENFEKLDLSPDFRMTDEAEQRVLRDQAMQTTLKAMYEEDDGDFSELSMLLFNGKNDDELCEVIEKLYNCSRVYPFPEVWLDGILSEICAEDMTETYFGRVLLSYISDAVHYCIKLNAVMKDAVENEGSEKLSGKMLPFIESDREQLMRIEQYAANGEWDAVHSLLQGFVFMTKAIVPPEFKGSYVDTLTKQLRANIKDTVKELAALACTDTDDFRSDADFFRLPVRCLIRAVKRFDAEYTTLKKQKNALDFSDIEHMTVELLVTRTEDGIKKTELAEKLSQRTEEILLDEYQDTNETQDMIFRAVSRGEANIFRVGDVKQCIYCFRQAMPELFVRLRESSFEYDGEHFPANIRLGCNFRSRREVTDTVNFLFSSLMRRGCGDVDYDEREKLVPAAVYPESDCCRSELHLLTLDGSSDLSGNEQQAMYVAGVVKKLLGSGMTVSDGGVLRPLQKSDICILMRSLSSRGTVYSRALAELGISALTEDSTDLFEATEVAAVMSLLRVIDNPCQDIPLLSVLLSPMFGFTPDELTVLRTDCEGQNLYARLRQAAEKGQEKFASFLRSVDSLRVYATSLSADGLIRRIYEQTGFYAAVGAMSDAEKRKTNLRLLLQYAATYEEQGYTGLSGFIRFADKLQAGSKTLPGGTGSRDGMDAVKIMTVHKSKGLEFPVVILAGCSTGFNQQDEKGCAVIDPMHGIGLKMRDETTLARFDSISHVGAKLSLKKSRISEEMRILYVAMTRAKEKLIMVCADKAPEKTLASLAANIFPGAEADSFCTASAKSHAEWILSAFLRHPDAEALREAAGASEDIVLPDEGRLRLVMADFSPVSAAAETRETTTEVSCDLLQQISERLSYRYKYAALSGILTKRTASEADTVEKLSESFAGIRPSFMDARELTPAGRGTAVHRFMQFCDFKKAETRLSSEIERLSGMGLLSEAEAKAVEPRLVRPFFESDLYRRIKNSGTVYREKKFMIQVPLRELYEDLPEYIDEQQIVQGIADCVFEEDGAIVIVDYKTDRTTDENELREKYRSQLATYRKAMELCTGLPVKQTLLWSFYLHKEIVCY